MRYQLPKKLMLFSFFVVGIFLLPNTSSAAVCTYQTRHPQTFETIKNLRDGVDIPFCDQVDENTCNQRCAGENNRVVINCTYASNYNTCADFEAQATAKAKKQQRQEYNDHVERLIDNRKTEQDAAGKCMCVVGGNDTEGGLVAVDGVTRDSCSSYDGGTPEFEQKANGVDTYSQCRWVLNEDVQATGDPSVNEVASKFAQLNRESNPLADYTGKVSALNKLRATSVNGFIVTVLSMAMGIMGTIALAVLIYGGFLWMTSAGNSSQVEKAQQILFWGALGIFLIFGSYAIITFIFEALNKNPT